MANYLFAAWLIFSTALLLLFFYAAYVKRRTKHPQSILGLRTRPPYLPPDAADREE